MAQYEQNIPSSKKMTELSVDGTVVEPQQAQPISSYGAEIRGLANHGGSAPVCNQGYHPGAPTPCPKNYCPVKRAENDDAEYASNYAPGGPPPCPCKVATGGAQCVQDHYNSF